MMIQFKTLVHFLTRLCHNFSWKYFSGPPGPPGGLKVEDIKNTSVILTWSRGIENHSPISNYTIQSRTFLSEYWKDMKTGKNLIKNISLEPK